MKKSKRSRNRKPRVGWPSPWCWALLIPALFSVNWLVQVARVPSQATAPLEPYFYKEPKAAWNAHGDLFRAHATPLLTPAFLAALAQVEAAGNPIATTYWRWRWSWNPLQWYAPASSAAGLFQMTDGMFAQARHLCLHDGKVVAQSKWYDWRGCWFNFLYNRLSPNHATEMTSAYLQLGTQTILERLKATPKQGRQTAALMHLCGPGEAERFAQKNFRLPKGKRCGDHSAADYLKRVETYQTKFEALAQSSN